MINEDAGDTKQEREEYNIAMLREYEIRRLLD